MQNLLISSNLVGQPLTVESDIVQGELKVTRQRLLVALIEQRATLSRDLLDSIRRALELLSNKADRVRCTTAASICTSTSSQSTRPRRPESSCFRSPAPLPSLSAA